MQSKEHIDWAKGNWHNILWAGVGSFFLGLGAAICQKASTPDFKPQSTMKHGGSGNILWSLA